MKKLTYDFVKEQFENEDYELLSKEYVNSDTRLNFRCPKGHEYVITWRVWQHGGRCAYCAKKVKKTLKEINLSFSNEGYRLLSTEYKNAFTKLEYICPHGHRSSMNWNNWSFGYRCPYCAGQVKPTLEERRLSFANEGYTLLTSEYKTNRTKLKYICPNKHIHEISWVKWCQGRRCRECSYILRGINNTGELNSNWNGGSSLAPYCVNWTNEFKDVIKERDGYKCLNPYCDSPNKNDLTIHHIDYNKKNCHPSNLITVCRSCNSKANYNRKWHIAWYQAIIKNRYKY